MIDFQKDVIERSFAKPVLVDFWAPWCGPCRVLGPVLEQLAAEQKDRWELAKVNTEEQPEVAEQYNIMSIPNVKLFHRGEVVGEFAGAYPRAAVEKWLDENLPDEASLILKTILEQEQGVPDAGVLKKLQRFVEDHPGHREGKAALARRLVFNQPEKAAELVEDVYLGDPFYEEAEDVRILAEFLTADFDATTPAAARMKEAQSALRSGLFEAAIGKVVEATSIDKTLLDDLPRRTAIALFHLWGHENELTRKYRRRFDMALY